jgi:hypothetical protein
MTSNFTTEKDFLFLIEIKNEVFYHNQAALGNFLKVLPDSVRIYAIIHAGMNTLKVYCVTKSHEDFAKVSEVIGYKTFIVDSRKMFNPSNLN